MISIISLWIPILLSAVIVFVVSSIIHMVLPYHRTDFGKVPDEDEVMDALRKFGIPPGEYVIPCAGSPKEMGTPEFIEKATKGPVAFMTVMESGPPSMAKSLVLWFIYCNRCWDLRRLYRRSCAESGSSLPGSISLCRMHCFHRVRPGTLAEFDLVQALLERYTQVDLRWTRIRAHDGWDVRMVVACLNK